MEQEHEAVLVRQEPGKVNYWRWQPWGTFATFGISYPNLTFTTSNDSESRDLFALTKDHGHAEDALPFHLCDNVLCVTTIQPAAFFFFFFALFCL